MATYNYYPEFNKYIFITEEMNSVGSNNRKSIVKQKFG